MKLIFEKSRSGRRLSVLPELDVPEFVPSHARKTPLQLPELSETDISRHYTELADHVYGVNNGFYPLGSCTMKYNPSVNEEMASLTRLRLPRPFRAALKYIIKQSNCCAGSQA